MNKFGLILCAVAVCLLVACGASSSKKCEGALVAGNLKEAEMHLKKISDAAQCRYYGGLLIEEYLAIDNLDKAIYVFENITGHCSMYQMQYSHYSSANYTQNYSQKIYTALLKAGRYDEAWGYHSRSYDGDNYAGNAPDYFAYMTDCIIQMCNSGGSSQVPKFIKQNGLWFLKNVDNTSSRDDYSMYCYDVMCSQLNKVYNNAK